MKNMISSPWLAEMNITLVAAQCHTSATPATQNARPCRQVQSQPNAISATPALQSGRGGRQVLCCYACHAK